MARDWLPPNILAGMDQDLAAFQDVFANELVPKMRLALSDNDKTVAAALMVRALVDCSDITKVALVAVVATLDVIELLNDPDYR